MATQRLSSSSGQTVGNRWRFLRNLGLNLLLVLGLYFTIRSCQQPQSVENLTESVIGTSTRGETIDLRSFRGRPVLLHFWAIWCGVCKAMSSNIEGIGKDYKVITVLSQSGNMERIRSYLNKNGLTQTVIPDPEGRVAKKYGVKAFPTSFIIDKRGKVQFIEIGYTTEIGLRLRLLWAER